MQMENGFYLFQHVTVRGEIKVHWANWWILENDPCEKIDCGQGHCEAVDDKDFYTCNCGKGYRQENSFSPCVDIDACSMDLSLCSSNTECIYTNNSDYICNISDSESSFFTIYNWSDMFNRTFPQEPNKTTIFAQKTLVRKKL